MSEWMPIEFAPRFSRAFLTLFAGLVLAASPIHAENPVHASSFEGEPARSVEIFRIAVPPGQPPEEPFFELYYGPDNAEVIAVHYSPLEDKAQVAVSSSYSDPLTLGFHRFEIVSGFGAQPNKDPGLYLVGSFFDTAHNQMYFVWFDGFTPIDDW